MRVLAFIYLLLLSAIFFAALIHAPITKLPTEVALSGIEEELIQQDLTEKEEDKFRFYSSGIRENQKNQQIFSNILFLSLVALLAGTAVLNAVNLVTLYREQIRKRSTTTVRKNRP